MEITTTTTFCKGNSIITSSNLHRMLSAHFKKPNKMLPTNTQGDDGDKIPAVSPHTWHANGSLLTISYMLEGEDGKQLAETLSYLINSLTICTTFPSMWLTLEFEQTHKLAFYYSQPEELKSCLDDNSVWRCDRSCRTKLDTTSPPILPLIHIAHSSSRTYTNTTGDLYALPHCNHWNLHLQPTVWVITCYIFHAGSIKLESGYETGTKSWTSQPLLSCLLLREVRTRMHTKFAQPTKTGTGERVKQNDYFREEQMGEFEGRGAGGRRRRGGGDQMKGKWNVTGQVVRRIVIVALKVYQRVHPQHSPNHTIYKMWKYCYLCEEGRGEVKCTPRQCEEMPLHFFYTHCTVTRSLVSWVDPVTEALAAITVCLHCIHPKTGAVHSVLKTWSSCMKNTTPDRWPISTNPLFSLK